MSELVTYLLQQLQSESDPIKQAGLIAQLRRQGVATKQIASIMNVHSVQVSQLARLNNLPEIVLDGYYSKLLTLSHLIFLSRLKNDEKVMYAYEQILAQNLSALATERLVRELLYQIKTVGHRYDARLMAQVQSVLEKKGTSMRVIQSRIGAKIVLEKKGNMQDTTAWIQNVMEAMQMGYVPELEDEPQSADHTDFELDPLDLPENNDKTLDQ